MGSAVSQSTSTPPHTKMQDNNNASLATLPGGNFVFLGGSCNPTRWRRDVAIPLLSKHEVAFYNPQVENWYPELMELENRAKHAAAVSLFVIDGQTRAIMSMMEAVEYITTKRAVAVAVVNVSEGQKIGEDCVSGAESKDLNRARGYLCDVAKRYGVEVHTSVEGAVEDAIQQVQRINETVVTRGPSISRGSSVVRGSCRSATAALKQRCLCSHKGEGSNHCPYGHKPRPIAFSRRASSLLP